MPFIEMTFSSDNAVSWRVPGLACHLSGLNTVANEGKCLAWYYNTLPVASPGHNTGPWCSGQAGECGLCVESASSHTIVYPFRSKIQTLRCLNFRLLNNRELSPLLIRNILTGMTLSEHDYHIVSTWHVSVWTQVPIDRSPHWSLSSLLSLTIGCPDICQWPGVARGRVQ